MEEERMESTEKEQAEVYTPRPAYQVWAARIGLVVVIIAVILYFYQIATGGM